MQKFRCAACDKPSMPNGSKVKYVVSLGRRARVCGDCAKRMGGLEKKEPAA